MLKPPGSRVSRAGKIVFYVLSGWVICIILLFLLIMGIALFPGSYHPPEGYTKEHHTYEEILEFAKKLDSDATVLNEYVDTFDDGWNRNYREYPAIINGIECHVSSVGDMVWDDYIGEFFKQYYVIDTDYDYLALKQILAELQPQWTMTYTDIGGRYNWNNVVSVSVITGKSEMMTDKELEDVWQQAEEIHSVYNALPTRKTIYFGMTVPEKYVDNSNGGKEFIRLDGTVIFVHFSEEEKLEIFKEYREAWQLLELGLPVYE